MKRRQRKTVLSINGESDSPRRRWPNERQSQNGSPSNPLANLLGQYNSDSEHEDDSKPRSHALNDQVNDFLKEIQSIAPEDSDKNNRNSSMAHPGSYWQECFDEQTGYPYYWHTETNQVTWEMPPELKMMAEKSQRETAAPHGSHIPPWSSMPPNKYAQTQSNIPEGMIPKEVVARNRNRQAGIPNKPAKPPSKSEISKSPGFKHHDSYDEGKIEMITSFGNDESESEESEREETPKKMPPSCLKKPPRPSHSRPTTSSQDSSSNKASESNESRVPLGPVLPPAHYGPQNKERLSEKLSPNIPSTRQERSSSGNSISHNEDDILTRLKNQAKLLQQHKNSESEQKSGKDLKLSLVPGYEDDSEGEDDGNSSSHSRKSSKPLFPISESAASGEDSNSRDKLTKKIDTGTSKLRIYEYKNPEAASEVRQEDEGNNSNDNNAAEDRQEESKLDQEAKTNKFLESIDAPTKAFQRKRRIAFDVAPNKSKTPEAKEGSPTGASLTDGVERRGLGFAKDDTRAGSGSPEHENNKPEAEAANKKSAGIAFVKSSTKEEEDDSGAGDGAAGKTKELSEAEKVEVKSLTEPIIEKLRFLSEGSPAASAVQVMAIQIQTLLSAWESGDLRESYLRNWLVGTGCELTRLEQTAAPPGWECQWDRSHKRYYYRNATTGDAQWTYPDTDIVGGTEEMELCTTPPPPEHEEVPIIEMSAQAATMSTTSKIEPQPPSTTEVNPPQPQEDPPPPPPPSISSPEPPPPPRIFAEDLKRSNENRKRKASPDISDRKGGALYYEAPKDAAKPLTEPLPPGVDPPEIAYTLPASALEAGVLYGAQQTNPIYAATLAGAGIPLLSHHHTALMQGQLMHYNPAYHQHLHNQALVAARLQGQEAVQFMVEYARVYENNQVIAKPPMKMPHETSLGSAINSFYSDIASIEKSAADIEKEKAEAMRLAATAAAAIESASPTPVLTQMPPQDAELQEVSKEKKKKKLKTGLGKKQKEMSSMVAKWQRAQKNYKEGH
ncbi:hypothetical protein TSAR_013641 [Trichomalopsis sarcophagae]|uniref:WW domain-containing protein n=1 Tax=Trichomalopsis sarcophagae TaxID=543379 RepID=A0A232EWA7_9HYME|nr:hypothetical protein TSAR_013641 [Trichomalopsis sarcophagae]